MRKTVSKIVSALVLSVLCFSTFSGAPRPAFGAVATEATQVMNWEELRRILDEAREQLDTLKKELDLIMEDVKTLYAVYEEARGVVDEFMGLYNDALGLIQTFQAELRRLSDIENGLFKYKFSGFRDFDVSSGKLTLEGLEKVADFPTRLWERAQRIENITKRGFENIKTSFEGLEKRNQTNQKIIKASQSSKLKGRDAVQGITNQLSQSITTELQALNMDFALMREYSLQMEIEEQNREAMQLAIIQNEFTLFKEGIEAEGDIDFTRKW